MSESISTANAGESNPYSSPNKQNPLIWLLGTFILLPFAIISALLTWFTFSFGRIKRSVIIVFGLVPAALMLIIFAAINVDSILIHERTYELVISFFDGTTSFSLWVGFFLSQLLVGTPLGILGGLLYSSYRWRTRPDWQDFTFRSTPWEIRKGKKVADEIRTDNNTPVDGFTLGINESGNRVIQTDYAAALHTLVVGASGSGKTTTIMSKMRDAIKRGQGIVFIDLKGGNDVPLILHKFAKRYNREFSHWLIQSREGKYSGPSETGPAYYDPLSRGDATRRTDMIIASREWSEQFYKQESQNYLQLLFNVLIGNPKNETSTLSDVVSMLNPRALLNRARPLENNPIYTDIISGIEALNDERISQPKRNAIEGLRSQLEVLLNSSAGEWLLVNPDGMNINLKQTAHRGDIVVFSLDSSQYPELSALVANLIIQDLKTVSSELREDPSPQPMQIFIDEFSAIGSENVIGFINKSRDAKMPVTLATQALGDLKRVNSAFLDQLIGIISSFIIHRANKDDDAEVYAGLTGKTIKKKFVQSVEHKRGRFDSMGKGSGTGSGRVEEVEDYRVSPNEIQELKMGEMIYLTKVPDLQIERVQCIPEDMVEEAIIEDEDFQPTVAIPLVISNPVDENISVVNNEYPTIQENDSKDYEPEESPAIPLGQPVRLSDPDKIAKILGKQQDAAPEISLPPRPQIINNDKSKLDNNIDSTVEVIKNRPRPGLPSKPATSNDKDEFEF
jgi:conjugal transfer pilus assembly protein TraD